MDTDKSAKDINRRRHGERKPNIASPMNALEVHHCRERRPGPSSGMATTLASANTGTQVERKGQQESKDLIHHSFNSTG